MRVQSIGAAGNITVCDGIVARPTALNAVAPAPVDVRTRADTIEMIGAVGIFFVIALLHSTSKFSFGEDSENSTLGQVVWGSMYVFAGIRLWQMRDVFVPLAKRSVPIAAWTGICLLSTVWSIDPFQTFKSGCELVGTGLVGMYFVTRFSMRQFSVILMVSFAIIEVLSVMLIFGSPARGKADYGVGPYNGVFSDKNGLGLSMALAAITFGLLILEAKGRRRAVLIGLLLLTAFLLHGANSMTALAATVVVGVLCAVALGLRAKLYGPMFAIAAAMVAFAIITFGFLAVDTGQIFAAFGRNANLTGRTEMWPGLITAIGDRPFLGFGYNTFFQDNGPVRDYLAGFVVEYSWTPPHAHNSFMQILIDTGSVGLAAFLCALVIGLWRAFRMFLSASNAFAIWPFAVILYLVFGSYDETYFGPPNTVQSIFFMAALVYPLREVAARVKARPRFSFDEMPVS